MHDFRERSWSITRAKTFRDCPRAAWFAYYSRGDPTYGERAAALRHLVTLPMAAGSAVDYVIARALRAYRDEGVVLKNLSAAGVRLLRKQVESSRASAGGSAAGTGPFLRAVDANLPRLQHHYYGYDLGRRYETSMEDRVAWCLSSFEKSEVWARVRRKESSGWHPIPRLGECCIPSFRTSSGLRVWSNIDFALLDRNLAFILDWKTGRATREATVCSREQLVVYAMWACRRFVVYPEQVRVQAVWLQTQPTWNPECVNRAEMELAAKRILADVVREAAYGKMRLEGSGKPICSLVRMENYPSNPHPRTCIPCRFRKLCPDGKDACAHL